MRKSMFWAVFLIFSFFMLLFIILPMVSLLSYTSGEGLAEAWCDGEVRESISLSLMAAFLSTLTAMVFGTPLGYVLARKEFPGKGIILAIINLPVLVPHTVAGIALLAMVEINIIKYGIPITFTDTIAGIVIAMLFVSAPIYIESARIAFTNLDIRYEMLARSMGATRARMFFEITLPLSWRALLSGALLAWSRAIGEFGAVIILAYYPRVAPVLIYDRFTAKGLEAAVAPSVILLFVCFLVIFLISLLINLPAIWRRIHETPGIKGRGVQEG